MGAPALKGQSLKDGLVQDFVVALYSKGLHPEDAAIEIGVPYENMLAIRAEYPELAAAWKYGEALEKGQIRKPRNPLEIKHSLAHRIWEGHGNLTYKFVKMIARIPDNEKGDERVMELMKHKIISETLPRETFGQQEITTKEEDPYAGMSDEELFKIAEKRIGKLADLQGQVEKAATIRASLAGRKVIDVSYTNSDPRQAESTGRAEGAPRGRPAVPLRVDAQAVAGDEHREEADGGVGGEPVLGEDDV